ncbi:hypothetical protein Vretimale_12155 [Volvox reticuliferus]|uniref:Uncharacterized protein n=1 Tax=Volvox reticuliferus TaxID=1737510 RepID=A0A8J4FWN4_9CHLO|nr:hypothetical protein Vretifemale_19750 [Volvox reticuliferus]GIL92184.1 hypothetical protein Vretifemale_19750 [Volvox reticuliferus]GIM08088.1 hypothetical protein Vretimale_12155 [Volvox reticuliferus]
MPIKLNYLERNPKHKLPYYTDWFRGSTSKLWCEVYQFTEGDLYLPMWLDEVDAIDKSWRCRAVWLHCSNRPNGDHAVISVVTDLMEVLNDLKRNLGAAQYTLLDAPGGKQGDANRFGGYHLMTAQSGRKFQLSVRRGRQDGEKLLLAVCSNAPPR